jgi:hypothetical protein
MFRLTAYLLAALAMVSLFAVTDTQAGNKHERRIHNGQKSVHFRTRQTIRMRSVNASNRYYVDRRLSRGTLSFKADGNRWNRSHRHRFHNRYRVNTGNVIIISVNGNRAHRQPVYRSKERNTYSGDVYVYSIPGVGTYSYGEGSSERVMTRSVPSAKIIDVKALKPNQACDMQAGVCVIKP